MTGWTERVAALPMYDLPELHEANDTLWAALRGRLSSAGVATPERLDRTQPLDALWTSPGLVLAQTCGYPLGKTLYNKVQLIGTPRYLAHGCEGPFHRSVVVVRGRDKAESLFELRGRRCAVNALDSNTGMNLLRAEIAPLAKGAPFFGAITVTGAHAESARLVAEDEADLAAIDCVTWAHLRRHRPKLTAGLRVLAWTTRTPGLPLITAPNLSRVVYSAISRALDEVMADPALRETRRLLLLDGVHALPLTHYRAANYLEELAARQGYPALI